MRLSFYVHNYKVIRKAVETLWSWGPIFYPAAKVYALGCVSLNTNALAKLAKIKISKKTKPTMSLVCFSISQVTEHTGQMDNATSSHQVIFAGSI